MLKLAQALQAAGASVYAISLRGHGGSGTAQRRRLLYRTARRRPGRPRQRRSASTSPASIARWWASPPAAAWCCASPVARRPACSTTTSRSRPTSRRTRPPTSPTRAGGPAWRCRASWRCRCSTASACRGSRDCRPSTSPRRQGRATTARRSTPSGWRRACSSAATGAPCWPRIGAPTGIVIGADDELFNADQFQPMVQAINPRIGVTIVPNEGHLGMIADPRRRPPSPPRGESWQATDDRSARVSARAGPSRPPRSPRGSSAGCWPIATPS